MINRALERVTGVSSQGLYRVFFATTNAAEAAELVL